VVTFRFWMDGPYWGFGREEWVLCGAGEALAGVFREAGIGISKGSAG
jgi:hypothetical protein